MGNSSNQESKDKAVGSKSRVFVAVGLLAALLVASGCNTSEDPRITASTEVPPPLTPPEARAVSLAATKVLHEANQARQALEAEAPEPEEALRRIEKGLTLVQIIENAVPWTQVETEIKAGDLVYRDNETDGGAFIPISDSLLALDVLTPAGGGTKGGNPTPAAASVGTTATEPPLVDRSELGYVALFLDVSVAKENLETAATRLRADDTDGADDALLAVQTEGVIFDLAELELPLEEAAANLKLAEYDVSEDRIDAASVKLATASESLKAYELDEGRHADEAREMHMAIDKLVDSLGDKTVDVAGRDEVEKKIAGWWEGIADWLTPTG